jgi:hypothetical protein
VNLDPHPGVPRFREILGGVKAKEQVQDVFAEIHECPNPDDPGDDDIWMTAMARRWWDNDADSLSALPDRLSDWPPLFGDRVAIFTGRVNGTFFASRDSAVAG